LALLLAATLLPATSFLSLLDPQIRDEQPATKWALPTLRHKNLPLIANLIWAMDESCRSIGDAGEEEKAGIRKRKKLFIYDLKSGK
jgi:hypothetical protein